MDKYNLIILFAIYFTIVCILSLTFFTCLQYFLNKRNYQIYKKKSTSTNILARVEYTLAAAHTNSF
jgi:hypothetical protein